MATICSAVHGASAAVAVPISDEAIKWVTEALALNAERCPSAGVNQMVHLGRCRAALDDWRAEYMTLAGFSKGNGLKEALGDPQHPQHLAALQVV